MMTILFWISLSMLVYIYLGYPLLLWALAGVFGRDPACHPTTPSVSLLIPAFGGLEPGPCLS